MQFNLPPPRGARETTSEWPLPALAAIWRALAVMRRQGRVARFFFMRKDPGIRLRIEARDEARDDVAASLARLARAGITGRARPTCYEPETFQFGGDEAMALAHDHFFRDSLECIRHDVLRRARRHRLDLALLSAAVMNHLFDAVLERYREEVWDVWQNVARIHGFRIEGSRIVDAPWCDIDAVERHAAPEEQAVLATYRRANDRYATGLNRLRDRGRLLYRRRLILPFICLFHWNRLALPLEARATICRSALAAVDPKRGLLGHESAAMPAPSR
jgi:thiopeptide-type bacteriocin biosynthesis protein